MPGRAIEFWYDFASTYSYLSAMRIDRLAAAAGVEVVWRPFLLGPIFKAQGWDSSPFAIYPAKGRHMVRDLERTAATRGLSFRMPRPFPAHSLLAARIALLGEEDGWVAPFSKGVFEAEFAHGADIAESATLARPLDDLGFDSADVLRRAGAPENKERLRARSEQAQARGIFGAPTFITRDGELFWGDDRLEQALDWPHNS